MSDVQLDTIRMHYDTIDGPTPAVVLLHGVTDSAEGYGPAMEALAGTFRMFAIDFRGHGLTDHRPGRYRIADHADDVGAFVQRVIGEPVVLAGHSLGGLVATYVAAFMPDLVRGVFLEDPPFYTAQMPALKAEPAYQMFAGLRALLQSRRGAQSEDDLVPLVGAWPIDPRLFEGRSLLEVGGPEAVASRARCLHRMDPEAIDPVLDGTQFDGFDVDAALAKIRVPVHLVAGDVAVGGTIAQGEVRRISELVPRFSSRSLPGVGHFVHHLATAAYVDELRTFVTAIH